MPDRNLQREKDVLYEAYYHIGMTQQEIADFFDSHQGSLAYFMRKHGIAPGHEGKGRSKIEDSEEIGRLYEEEEMSLYDIADKYDVTTSGVKYHLKKVDVETRSKGQYKRYNDIRLKTNILWWLTWEMNMNGEDIAELVGCSKSAVIARMKRRNIPRHKPGRKKKYSKQELAEWLIAWKKEHGSPPPASNDFFLSWPGPSAQPYVARWGSLTGAYEAVYGEDT